MIVIDAWSEQIVDDSLSGTIKAELPRQLQEFNAV